MEKDEKQDQPEELKSEINYAAPGGEGYDGVRMERIVFDEVPQWLADHIRENNLPEKKAWILADRNTPHELPQRPDWMQDTRGNYQLIMPEDYHEQDILNQLLPLMRDYVQAASKVRTYTMWKSTGTAEKLKDATEEWNKAMGALIQAIAGQKGKFMTPAQLREIYFDGFNQAHYSHVHPDTFPRKEIEKAADEYFKDKA